MENNAFPVNHPVSVLSHHRTVVYQQRTLIHSGFLGDILSETGKDPPACMKLLRTERMYAFSTYDETLYFNDGWASTYTCARGTGTIISMRDWQCFFD